jgi:hypothetical protein
MLTIVSGEYENRVTPMEGQGTNAESYDAG